MLRIWICRLDVVVLAMWARLMESLGMLVVVL